MKAKIKLTRVILIFLLSGFISITSYTQTVKVEGGLVEGTVENGITVFKGIPFAAPPVGDLRWRPPQPVKSWNDVLKADRFCPACPQFNIPMLGFVNAGISEDCLYLNIWKPNDTSEERLPVIVWIYGGGFFIGSTSQSVTSGEQLTKKGIIVVSIAYRLGALGFLSHPDLTAESENNVSGNYGLLDQIAGLKWVQNNIEAFGGDPGNVTIFGESAGGQSVSMLAASPLAKGLFHRAICMSGGSFFPALLNKEPNSMQFLKGAEKILTLYPDSTDVITRKSMADLFRDLYFGWQTYTWATLQTKTGKSPVFVYYFDQLQPASAVTLLLKSNGAYHGSDCTHAFDHLDQDPKIKYTDEDRRLSEIMVNYWTNFAKYGDPNGQGLPEWPAYVNGKPTVMYLKSDLQLGSFPNIDKIKIIDEYYTWKRTTVDVE